MQVWTNCRLYNSEGDAILELCQKAENAVEARWQEQGLRAALDDDAAAVQKKTSRKGRKSKSKKNTGPYDEDSSHPAARVENKKRKVQSTGTASEAGGRRLGELWEGCSQSKRDSIQICRD